MVALLLESSKDISVVVVEGCGGFGKTTLMKQVYEDQRVREHFDLRIWLSASTGPAGSSTLDSIVVEDVNELDSYGAVSVKLRNLILLGETFNELLAGRRFLLVLDDVQDEHLNGWDDLCRNLIVVGEDGSKVVVTTRSSDLAKMTRIRMAGRQIVTLLSGCPDAIQMIASVLSHRPDVDFWRNILKSCEDLRNENDSISVVLRIIYQYLSPHLKLCLLYCSLYPRRHKFEKPNLIHYWVAGGFVLPHEGKSIEDLAARDFDDLSSMSFFRLSRDRYILHDSVHEIASQMFVFPCSGSDWLSRIPKQVVHLSLISDNIQASEFKDLYKFKNLRSLVLMPRYSSRLDHLTEELLLTMKSLRMLELSHTGIKELPVSIGELKHLRFLNLSHTRIKSLPESLTNLRKLQILDLSGCIMLCSFPTWINKISSLRHLKARPDLICTIEGIGKLSSLQNLEEFRVRKNEGHKIEELKNMNELHGKLQIRNMENMKSETEARGADLQDKVYLEGLELEWCDDRHDDELIDMSVDDEEILGGLRPPSNLKMISIKGFDGSKSPPGRVAYYPSLSCRPSALRIAENGKCSRLSEKHYVLSSWKCVGWKE
uniref:Uncharacterized protein n=1 Tax=Ananas comosus var. bracteatus TaxID=296719 RepID=A0A6V7PDV8_ANACO|nr:unnamed protein product [Ananas comosus var. bracteatus]